MEKKRLDLVLKLPPSLNSAFRNVKINLRIPTLKAKEWTRESILITKREIFKQSWIKTDKKTVMEIRFFWKDKRKHDCDNYLKVMNDSFNGLIWIDDSQCLPRVIDFQIDPKNPRVELSFYEL